MLRRVRLPHVNTAHSRRAHLHPVHALLLLDHLPDLVVLGAGQDDHCTAVRAVPAVLTVFVFECDSVAAAEAFAVGGYCFVDGDDLDSGEIAHACVCTAFLGFLCCFAEEAVLVGVLAAVLGYAAPVQRAEDGVWAVVFGEVFFVLGQLGFIVVELAGGRVELVGVWGGEDAVFDECDAQVAQLLVDPAAYGVGKVVFELVD
jgi:hypothetical protein